MNNFIFKSANRLIKNSPIPMSDVMSKLVRMQEQLRMLRQDNVDVKLMLNRLLIEKHLQMQVDDYYKNDNVVHPEDVKDLD